MLMIVLLGICGIVVKALSEFVCGEIVNKALPFFRKNEIDKFCSIGFPAVVSSGWQKAW
jgi:hypothetical protein